MTDAPTPSGPDRPASPAAETGPASPGSAPGPAAPARSGLVHDLVLPVAQAAVGGIVSAAVGHVAAKTSAPGPGAARPQSSAPGPE